MVSGPKTAIRAADASSTQPGSVAGLMHVVRESQGQLHREADDGDRLR
jgi:hypothetical protein